MTEKLSSEGLAELGKEGQGEGLPTIEPEQLAVMALQDNEEEPEFPDPPKPKKRKNVVKIKWCSTTTGIRLTKATWAKLISLKYKYELPTLEATILKALNKARL